MAKDKNKKVPFNVLRKGLVGAALGVAMFAGSVGMLAGCGAAGEKGEPGAPGANGSTWYNGEADPTDTLGVLGDYYFETDTGNVWFRGETGWAVISNLNGEDGTGTQGPEGPEGEKGETGETGPQGPEGPAGKDGSVWHSGAVVPENTLGKDGDFYLNTVNYDIYQKTTGSWTKIGNIKGADGKDGNDGADGTDSPIASQAEFMHISFDDVTYCFQNLKNKAATYTSLYDEPFFAWLKGLNEQYGAKFSLYVYNDSISEVSNKFAAEFLAAKDWLKIGLHASNGSHQFTSATYEQGKNAWNSFVDNVVRITGSYLNIDRIPRLHTFAGSLEALRGMRDANCGALGFLSADDSRLSYYFDTELMQYMYSNDHVTDYENGLVFLTTDLRTDWFKPDFSSAHTYNNPTEDNVYDELVARYTNASYANSISSYILFGHEWQFYTGSSLNSNKAWFEDACRFADEYDIDFDFAQNRKLSPTKEDIYPETTVSGSEWHSGQGAPAASVGKNGDFYLNTTNYDIYLKTSGNWNKVGNFGDASGENPTDPNPDTPTDPDQDETTVKFVVEPGTGQPDRVEKDMTVVDEIADIDFTAGYSVAGTASGDFPPTKGRAVGMTKVLAVNGGETLAFVDNLAEVFGSTNLSFAVLEFSAAPLSRATLSTTDNVSAAAVGKAWLSTAHILQANTKYVIIAFKNGDGSVDFTEDQVAALTQCLALTETTTTPEEPGEGGDPEQGETPVDPSIPTTTFNGKTLTIVEDFAEVEYIAGKSIGGNQLTYTDTPGRAVSQSQVLKVDATNRKLTLVQGKTSVQLKYTIYEFAGIPMDSSTFTNSATAGSWIDGDYVLNSSTQYIMIVFRNETNSNADFSAEDLALLNSCVTFAVPEVPEEPEVPDEPETPATVAVYYGEELEIVESISEMTFDPEYAPPGYAGGAFAPATVTGRATCITAVLAVEGGETLALVDNLEEVFGSTNLQFAVLEFSSAILSKETMSFPNARQETATEAQKAACAGAWLSGPHTLQANTRYVMIAFKNNETGNPDFTEEQVALLGQCLTIVTAE